MFDIGFAELVIIAVVGLLVIGPERLPGAIRTGSAWLNQLRRGFNDIKREVQQELHNDAVMQELRKTGEELKSGAEDLKQDIQKSTLDLPESVPETAQSPAETGPADKNKP
jgi:sec-independent protein translocase protein TatB